MIALSGCETDSRRDDLIDHVHDVIRGCMSAPIGIKRNGDTITEV